MLSDTKLSFLQNELIGIYNDIEIELIVSVAKRILNYKTVEGTLDWHLRKLSELNLLNKDLLTIISKYTNKSESAIKRMLKQAQMSNFNKKYIDEAFKEGVSKVDYKSLSKSPNFEKLLNSSVYELKESLSLINTKAIQSAKEQYTHILNKAYVESNAGVYSVDEAIAKGIKEMAKNGIKGATYESGRKIGIEPAVRRDTLSTIIHNVNEGAIQGAQEMGTNYVEVSQHLGARVSNKSKIANHAGWQGKVYQIEGSSEEYGNLVEETGYGDIEGLGGVNCRHRVFPYFPGISVKKHDRVDEEENKEVYEASQRLRALERGFRANKKEWYVAKIMSDDISRKKYEKKAKKILKEIHAIEKKYPTLRSKGSRSLVLEDLE